MAFADSCHADVVAENFNDRILAFNDKPWVSGLCRNEEVYMASNVCCACKQSSWKSDMGTGVHDFPAAYKSFMSIEEANAYMGREAVQEING